ncbi:hypothetical protein GQ44DRAFT_161546 [Phaeosphaeriaceae sp. PMI808]|nr:hypothetical protein GQ44DRAFT_161546 [Phaeosphaeriaceae sp. PMI808]
MAFLKSTAPACLFVLVSILASPITAAVLQNYTIALPKGSSDHGEPGLLCTPAKAVDLLTFYLLNYVAHAATVLTRPGERADDYLVTVIGSLLFPSLGLYRGVEAILCGAVFTKNDNLRKAARSGALCIVVRGADWRPENGESVSNVILKRASTALENGVRDAVEHRQPEEIVGEKDIHLITYNPPYIFSKFACPVFAHRRIIHGAYSLPAGYSFAIVPHDAQFVNLTGSATSHPTIEVSATYNMVKAVAALAQSAYALYTLYRARGDQISQFGYAAFGLTVAPYAVMSIMNLVGNLCRPEYPSLYLVESSIMDEARRRGGLFEGAVAKIREFESRTVTASDLPGAEDIDDLHFSSTITGETVAHFSVPPTKWQQTNTPTNNPSPTIPEKLSPISTPTQTELIQHSIPIAPLPPGLNYHNTQPPFTLFIPCHTPSSTPQPQQQPPHKPTPSPQSPSTATGPP